MGYFKNLIGYLSDKLFYPNPKKVGMDNIVAILPGIQEQRSPRKTEKIVKQVLEERLAIEEVEERLGITKEMNDCPPDRYCGDDCPTSGYYLDEKPDFEESHRTADKALAQLEKYLSNTPQS